MNSRWRRLLALLAICCTFALAGAVGAYAQAGRRCFPETGYCIAGPIRDFWERNGGLMVFGFPITQQQAERIEGRPTQVQWFERSRLELHPENQWPYDVLLGRMGADRLGQMRRDWKSFPRIAPAADCRAFAETGHAICGALLAAWQAGGLNLDGDPSINDSESLALFGLPLSDLQTESIQGKDYQVQWFERARFELHPENAAPYNVLLGLLGNEVRAGSAPAPAPAPAANTCADVPDPINARIRPGKCINQGDKIEVDIFGFTPNEPVGFWLNAPDGSIYGTRRSYNIGNTGSVSGFPLDIEDMPVGIWSLVFQSSNGTHQSVIYFKVSKP
jgi:hypothetical protein